MSQCKRKILNTFQSKIFPITNLNKIPTPEPALSPTALDTLKQTIDLYKTNQAEIEQIVNQAVYVMIDLRNAAVR